MPFSRHILHCWYSHYSYHFTYHIHSVLHLIFPFLFICHHHSARFLAEIPSSPAFLSRPWTLENISSPSPCCIFRDYVVSA
ncbi:hypothetical protein M405DRAFT_255670 [Rhizopogon salebrosus TDB-379]|nr:hypothetical protein M405DRAFT_255670 [Rhizopogon salebrosus TDB-379]